MFNTIRKFFRRLYVAFKYTNEAELIAQLVKVELLIGYEPLDINKKSRADRLSFLRDCHQIYNSDTFKEISLNLKHDITNNTINGASNLHHFICGKMTLYGIGLLETQYQVYAAMFEQEKKVKEQTFDPYSPL